MDKSCNSEKQLPGARKGKRNTNDTLGHFVWVIRSDMQFLSLFGTLVRRLSEDKKKLFTFELGCKTLDDVNSIDDLALIYNHPLNR